MKREDISGFTKLSLSLITILLLSIFSSVALPDSSENAVASSNDPTFLEQAEALFKANWSKADGPVVAQKTNRSWLWGPGPFTFMTEQYEESSPMGRPVMYFDKARMERTSLDNNLVTNGLLVVEMLSGKVQTGDNTFGKPGWYQGVKIKEGPAEINLIGDPGNWLTYARLSPYASLNLDKRSSNRVGQSVDQELTENKGIQPASLAGQQSISYYEEVLGHNIPKVFWDFLNQNGMVYSPESGSYVQGQPINWLADAGYPVTEPYWVRQRVGGIEKEVMFQAFQRRTLTFTPDNASAFFYLNRLKLLACFSLQKS